MGQKFQVTRPGCGKVGHDQVARAHAGGESLKGYVVRVARPEGLDGGRG